MKFVSQWQFSGGKDLGVAKCLLPGSFIGAPALANGNAATDAQINSLPNAPPAPDRPVSWKLLVPNVVHDQKPIWLFPKSVAEGKHLKPTRATLSITAGLVAVDPSVEFYFRGNRAFGTFNQSLSGSNTS